MTDQEDVKVIEDGKLSLEDMIDNALSQLNFADEAQKAITQLQCGVRLQERRHREVNQMFNECKSMIDLYTKAMSGDPEEPVKIDSGSDSDDDVQFVETTYDPDLANRNKQTVVLQPPGVQALLRPNMPGSVQLQAYQVRNANGEIVTQYCLPQTTGMRQPLTAQVVSQTVQHMPQNLRSIVKEPAITPVRQPPPPARILQQPPKHPDLVVGMKLFGKKNNDVWYKGTLIEVINKDRPRPERKYKLKYDGRGLKTLIGKHLAFHDTPNEILPVGSRIIGKYWTSDTKHALYKDDQGGTSYYAGIVAEPPSLRNNHRYLVFFDDGYAQYCTPNEIHRIFEQSVNVWEDTYTDSQDFIRSYLQQYPERPMVRLQKGQTVKTEWNGNWWVAKVQEVDASLVKMHFEADRRVEWIYRGSTRLEPLYTELAHQHMSKQLGRHGRRHNLNMKSNKKPLVEYTRGLEEEVRRNALNRTTSSDALSEPGQKKSVAKKSSTKKPQSAPILSTKQGKDMASVLQERLSSEYQSQYGGDGEALGELVEVNLSHLVQNVIRKHFTPHQCNHLCIKNSDDDPEKMKGQNPLSIPMVYGWERQVTKQKSSIVKRGMIYRAPCGRRMRTMNEVDQYLKMTNSQLTIDLFCFEPSLQTDLEYVPCKTFCDIKDLSYGKESVPISCVNGIDRSYPEYVEYSNQRTPAKGVQLNLDPEFLACCDCTDGCRDKNKCQCIQMTIEAAKSAKQIPDVDLNDIGYTDRRLGEPLVTGLSVEASRAGNPSGRASKVGYVYRRLMEHTLTGIYECNSRCRCDKRCSNRVVQNGLTLRLQVFKTEKRGWGIRCCDDIPEGGFICIYAGQLLTEQGANEDGQQYGDEYLAELDYIEVVERSKEGYESDVNEDEGLGKEEDGEEFDSDDDLGLADESDSDCSVEKYYTKQQKRSSDDNIQIKIYKKKKKKKADESGVQKLVLQRLPSKEQSWAVKSNSGSDVLVISDDDSNQSESVPERTTTATTIEKSDSESKAKHAQSDEFEKTEDSMSELKITEPTSLNTENVDSDESDKEQHQSKDGVSFKRATRSGSSRFRNLPDPKTQKPVSPLKKALLDEQKSTKKKKDEKENFDEGFTDTRKYFQEEFCYVMDAKSMGNIGRYLNHSCTPNVFVQNVFVDTHDIRFPWVAFFAAQRIRAGTELTWDYNYEVGSVPGKILYCYCGSAECRGRLL